MRSLGTPVTSIHFAVVVASRRNSYFYLMRSCSNLHATWVPWAQPGVSAGWTPKDRKRSPSGIPAYAAPSTSGGARRGFASHERRLRILAAASLGDGVLLVAGDGAAPEDERGFRLSAGSDAEVLVFDRA